MSEIQIKDPAHWHALRAKTVGASEVAALYGCHAHTSLYALWQVKAGRIPPPNVTGDRPKWGLRLEDVIAQAFHEEGHCAEMPQRCGYFVHPKVAGLGCTPDFLLKRDGAVVECKNVDWLVRRRQWGHEPPLALLLQVQTQLACTGYDHGYLVALVGGNELVHWRFDARPKLIADIERRVKVFWDSIAAGEEPPIDGHPATLAAVKDFAPVGDNSEIELFEDEFAEACAMHANAREAMKRMDVERREAEARIIRMLRGAQRGYGLGWSASLVEVPGTPDREAKPGEIIKGRKGSVRVTVREATR